MARTLRINLRERVTELLAESGKKCSVDRRCAILQAVVDVYDGRRPGITVEEYFDFKTGKRTDNRAVLWTKTHEFAELSYCPFCGEKVGRVAKKKARAS